MYAIQVLIMVPYISHFQEFLPITTQKRPTDGGNLPVTQSNKTTGKTVLLHISNIPITDQQHQQISQLLLTLWQKLCPLNLHVPFTTRAYWLEHFPLFIFTCRQLSGTI